MISGQYSIRAIEQLGRRQAFIMFYEMLKDKGLPPEQVWQLAADKTSAIMTDFRPSEMPAIYKKLGPLGTTVSPLARFKHNAISQLAVFLSEWIRHKYDPKLLAGVVISFGMWQLWGGLLGLPLREDFDMLGNLMKYVGGVKNNITQAILQSDNPSFITHGLLSRVTGADLSSSFSLGQITPTERSLFPLFNKLYNQIDAALEFASKQTGTSGMAALKEVLPVSGIAQATLEWLNRESTPNKPGQVGVLDKHGNRSVNRPNDPLSKEWVLRGLTMRTLPEGKKQRTLFELKRDEEILNNRKERLVDRAFGDYKRGVNVMTKYAEDMRDLKMTPNDLYQGLRTRQEKRMLTEEQRFGGVPPQSPNQIRKFQELQKYK